MFLNCGIAYMYRYFEGRKSRPAGAAIIGTSVHASVDCNMQSVIDNGSMLDLETCTDMAAQAVDDQWTDDVNYEHDQDFAKDTATIMAHAHHKLTAPNKKPVEIEKRFVVHTPFNIDLVGRIDLIEEGGVITDLKTSKRKPQKGVADASDQLKAYVLSQEVAAEVKRFPELPHKAGLDYVFPDRDPMRIETEITQEDITAYTNRLELVAEAIRKEVFLPAPEGSWQCTERWCGFWPTCVYARGRKRPET